jgi:signal transduction histidine kinase
MSMSAVDAPAHILVVDDDAGLLRLVEKSLKREGFATATAASGKEALSWLAKNTAELMLLDLKLQDMEGAELVNHFTSLGRAVPFIVITGQGDERVAVDMMKRGALDYLVKDAQFIEFVPTVVRRALEHGTERKRLEREIMEISEREQRRFGHDLHDGLGQRLTGLEMLSHALAEDLKGHAPALAQQASRLNRELRETVTQARLISHSLAPVPLEGDGLMQGLSELAASTSRIPGVKCEFLCHPPVCIQDVTTATHLYRIAQEAVNNALKHGQARKVDITLTEGAEGVELSVENNGRPLPASPPANRGMGLNVMRYRAEMIGASLSLGAGKRKGVRVSCTLRRKT